MKKLLVVSIISVLMLSGALTVQAGELKIAYIDVQRLIMESTPGKAFQSDMEKLRKDKIAEVGKIEAKIKQLSEQLSSKSPLTESAKADLDSQLQSEMNRRDRYVKDAQEELRRKEVALLKPIQEALDTIINDYGKANSYDLIINGRMPGLIFASERMDITETILNLYNKKAQASAEPKKAKK